MPHTAFNPTMPFRACINHAPAVTRTSVSGDDAARAELVLHCRRLLLPPRAPRRSLRVIAPPRSLLDSPPPSRAQTPIRGRFPSPSATALFRMGIGSSSPTGRRRSRIRDEGSRRRARIHRSCTVSSRLHTRVAGRKSRSPEPSASARRPGVRRVWQDLACGATGRVMPNRRSSFGRSRGTSLALAGE